MPLPPGVDMGPAPGTPDEKSTAQLSNFDNWCLTGKFEHMPSSVVDSAAYDLLKQRLMVRFKGSSDGTWYEVSTEKAQSFYFAGSKMGWIWTNCLVRGPGGKGKTQVPSGSF